MNYVRQLRFCHGKFPILKTSDNYHGSVQYVCSDPGCKLATVPHYSALGMSEEMARESWDSGYVSIGGVWEDWMKSR